MAVAKEAKKSTKAGAKAKATKPKAAKRTTRATQKPRTSKKQKIESVVLTAQRKTSVARGYLSKGGSGEIRVNGKPLTNYFPEMITYRVMEPLMLAGGENALNGYSLEIDVSGGGITGQSDSVRQIIAKALVEVYGDDLKERFIAYDRSLLVSDPRRTEPHKPSRSKQGPRRKKQLSKR